MIFLNKSSQLSHLLVSQLFYQTKEPVSKQLPKDVLLILFQNIEDKGKKLSNSSSSFVLSVLKPFWFYFSYKQLMQLNVKETTQSKNGQKI